MPMIHITLVCGCPIVWRYAPRVKWSTLTIDRQKKIIADAAAAHHCKKPKKSKAPPLSPEPQKP